MPSHDDVPHAASTEFLRTTAPTAIIELVEHIAKAIVDNPDHVRVHGIEGEYSLIIELRVAKEDIGKVMRVDRTFAWEDKFKRLLQFEHIQQRHFGMKLLAYTLINVWELCGA